MQTILWKPHAPQDENNKLNLFTTFSFSSVQVKAPDSHDTFSETVSLISDFCPSLFFLSSTGDVTAAVRHTSFHAEIFVSADGPRQSLSKPAVCPVVFISWYFTSDSDGFRFVRLYNHYRLWSLYNIT